MPKYIVTINLQEDLEVTANSAQEAVKSIELIANDENQINLTIMNVEEVIPPPSLNTYTSLKSIHASTTKEPEYARLTTITKAYTRLT